MKIVILKALPEPKGEYEQIEKRIKALFRREIYLPILKELYRSPKALTNSVEVYPHLVKALMSGKVTFNRGTFSGQFNASITKELRALGARYDAKTSAFKLVQASLPLELRATIAASESRFREKIAGIDRKLAQILPDELAGKLKCSDVFDSALWKANLSFEKNVRAITITPELSADMRKKIAKEWQNNMDLWIKDFSEKEIKSLREQIKKSVFAGNRYESAVDSIRKSYSVSENKAKFLAKQETALLVSKFQETRYRDAGSYGYTWHNVTGSKAHPVRPRHKALAEASAKGTIYRWDNPPNTAEPGEPPRHNHPKQDYNCRCYARAAFLVKK